MLIERKFKTDFIIKFCLVVILGSIVVGGILYLLYRKDLGTTYFGAISILVRLRDVLIPSIVFTLLLQIIILSVITILLTLYVSHKIAGPIYRLERVLDSIGKGDLTIKEVRLRARDQIQLLADSFANISMGLSQVVREIKETIDDLEKGVRGVQRLLLSNDKNSLSKTRVALKDLRETTDRMEVVIERVKLQ